MLGWLSWGSNKGEPSQHPRSFPSPILTKGSFRRWKGLRPRWKPTACSTGKSLLLAENPPVIGKPISIAMTCLFAKDDLTRAWLRGEWKVRNHRRSGSSWVGGREINHRGLTGGSWLPARAKQSYLSYGRKALNTTQLTKATSSLSSIPHPKKAAPGENNMEGKLNFASEVALPAPPLLFPVGTDTAVTGEAWRVAACPLPEGLGQTWELRGVREMLFLTHKIWSLVGAHALPRNEGHICPPENMSPCHVSTGSVLGASRGAILPLLQLPPGSGLPVKQPPLCGLLFHLHLPKDAFPSSGINLALNECRKENTFMQTPIR